MGDNGRKCDRNQDSCKPLTWKSDTQTVNSWANTLGGGAIRSCIKCIGCVSKPNQSRIKQIDGQQRTEIRPKSRFVQAVDEEKQHSNGEFLGEYAGWGCNLQLYQAYRLQIQAEPKSNQAYPY